MNTYVTEVQVWATVRVRAHSIDEARAKVATLHEEEVSIGGDQGLSHEDCMLSPGATIDTEIYGADIWQEEED